MKVRPEAILFVARTVLPLIIQLIEEKLPNDEKGKLVLAIVKGLQADLGIQSV